MRNKIRVLLFLLAFDFLLIALGYTLAGRDGILWFLFVSLSINFLVYFYSDSRVLNQLDLERLGGHLIEGPDGWGIFSQVTELAQRLRVPRPRIMCLDLPSPQVMTLGSSNRRATIVITQGFLQDLTPADQSALLTYAMVCINSNQVLVFGVVSSLVAFFEGLFSSIDRFIRFLIGTPKTHWSGHLSQKIFTPALFAVVRFLLNERQYYLIDAKAAELLKDPRDLGTAFQKLESLAHTVPLGFNLALAHFFAVNPLTGRNLHWLVKIQPRTEKRIEKLVGCYPL